MFDFTFNNEFPQENMLNSKIGFFRQITMFKNKPKNFHEKSLRLKLDFSV